MICLFDLLNYSYDVLNLFPGGRILRHFFRPVGLRTTDQEKDINESETSEFYRHI